VKFDRKLFFLLSIVVIVYITSSLQKPLHTAVIVLEKDNILFNSPILNFRSLKTVSSIDVYLNLYDCNSVLQFDVLSEFRAHSLLILHSILCI